MIRFATPVLTIAIALTSSWLHAALVLNPTKTITQQLDVNVIQVAKDDGSDAAPLFGTASQQTAIFSMVNQIWGQAGIKVNFSFAASTLKNTNSLTGINSLEATVAAGDSAGLTKSGKIDLFMVRASEGLTSPLSDNSASGLAFVPGDGITMWAGPDLVNSTGGQEGIASVLSHEIGHNLGLFHAGSSSDPLKNSGDNTKDKNGISYSESLMVGSGSPTGLADGERLLQSQIDRSLASNHLTPVPEPTTLLLFVMAMSGSGLFSRRRKPRKNEPTLSA